MSQDPTLKIVAHYLLMAIFIVLGSIFYANYDSFGKRRVRNDPIHYYSLIGSSFL